MTGTPKPWMFSIWRLRLAQPSRTAARFSAPSASRATPPCILSARTVATSTTASGSNPALRHLMSMNFSPPRSEPNPASVTVYSASLRAVRVAVTELQPWAILANGPPWTKAGVFSSVCTMLGRIASFSKAVIGPGAIRSRAKTGSRPRVSATMMLPRRSLRSPRLSARQKTAITSDATVMSNPSSRGKPLATPPSDPTIERSARSLRSTTRRHEIRRESMPSALPQ